MRRSADLEGDEALEAADAMLGVHDEVALAQDREVGDELVGAAARARGPREAVAEQVLLGQDGQPGRHDAVVQRQDRERHADGGGQIPCPLDPREGLLTVVLEHLAKALESALAGGGHERPVALGLQLAQVCHDGIEEIDRAVGPLTGEVAGRPPREIDHGVDARRRARRGAEVGELEARPALDQPGEALLVQVEKVGRERAVGCGAEARSGDRRRPAGLVVLADQGRPGIDPVPGKVIEGDLDRLVQIVEERCDPLVEERQPMLHAGIAAAGPDRLEERVAGDRAELLEIALPEALDRLLIEHDLADRPDLEPADTLQRALGQRVEGADRLDRAAEEVEPQRLLAGGREDVQQAAADGVLAGLDDRAGAGVAVATEIVDEGVPIEPGAGTRPEMPAPDGVRGGDTLKDRVGGGEHEPRPALPGVGETGQRLQPLRHDPRGRRDPVVGQAVPGREGQDLDGGREEPDEAGELRQARLVAGDEEHGRGGTTAQPVGDEACVEPLAGIGDERAACCGRCSMPRWRLEDRLGLSHRLLLIQSARVDDGSNCRSMASTSFS